MDGTGFLFEPLLPLISATKDVITFPSSGVQTYESIYAEIKKRIPIEAFYILAESFSGPLAARLASENLEQMKGIIFVATFLTCPSKNLVRIAQNFPIKTLIKFPLASAFIRKFLLGEKFPLELFYRAIASVSERELKARLVALEGLQESGNNIYSHIPTLYLRAENDLLVSKKHVNEFVAGFPNITVRNVPGTHFLLQSNPQACAEHINNFLGVE
jgi:pimeloyl-ACP methyl ester carboxylesterase